MPQPAHSTNLIEIARKQEQLQNARKTEEYSIASPVQRAAAPMRSASPVPTHMSSVQGDNEVVYAIQIGLPQNVFIWNWKFQN